MEYVEEPADVVYRVHAFGIHGAEYIYRVDAPPDAVRLDVIASAYEMHRRALLSGEITQPLGPRVFVADR